jgi:hypothetical protein
MKNYLTYRVASSLMLAVFFTISVTVFDPREHLNCNKIEVPGGYTNQSEFPYCSEHTQARTPPCAKPAAPPPPCGKPAAPPSTRKADRAAAESWCRC